MEFTYILGYTCRNYLQCPMCISLRLRQIFQFRIRSAPSFIHCLRLFLHMCSGKLFFISHGFFLQVSATRTEHEFILSSRLLLSLFQVTSFFHYIKRVYLVSSNYWPVRTCLLDTAFYITYFMSNFIHLYNIKHNSSFLKDLLSSQGNFYWSFQISCLYFSLDVFNGCYICSQLGNTCKFQVGSDILFLET